MGEVSFAGGLWNTNNSSAYYYLNKSGGSATGSIYWWTMSPYYWSGGSARVFFVFGFSDPGRLNDYGVNYASGVRPVVSLKSCTSVSEGNGTANTPYEVSISDTCAKSIID